MTNNCSHQPDNSWN